MSNEVSEKSIGRKEKIHVRLASTVRMLPAAVRYAVCERGAKSAAAPRGFAESTHVEIGRAHV